MGRLVAMMASPGIALHDLTLAYNGHPAVHHLDGCFARGSLTAIAGPNGAGKSTVLKAIAGLIEPRSGQLERFGVNPRELGYLPQSAEIDRSFPISVADTVALGAWGRAGVWRRIGHRMAADAERALDQVGLRGFENRPISSLSAGQFQRVLFARLIVQDAPVMLLDEPFNAIDLNTKRDLLSLILDRWHRPERTVIVVSHDLDEVKAHFPETLLIAREKIAWGPTREVLTRANLARARAMAETWDEDAAICGRREGARLGGL